MVTASGVGRYLRRCVESVVWVLMSSFSRCWMSGGKR